MLTIYFNDAHRIFNVLFGKIGMHTKKKIVFFNILIVTTLTLSSALAKETIIKEEKLSFEKCLKVISTSQNKLSIAPQIKDMTDQKRVAIFELADGTLTIHCDGIKGLVIVSTNTD